MEDFDLRSHCDRRAVGLGCDDPIESERRMNGEMIGPANGMTTKALPRRVLPTRLQIERAGIGLMTDQNTNGRSERIASLTNCRFFV